MNGYGADAKACEKALSEILEGRRPDVWRHLTPESEVAYVAWLARWATHWRRLEAEWR